LNHDPLEPFYMTSPLTEEELIQLRPLAEERLRDPSLLDWVRKVLALRIVGEAENALLTYLVCLSSLSETPLSLIIAGPSSSGKSWIAKNVVRFFPRVMNPTRLTPAFLDRANADLTGVIFYAVELPGLGNAGSGQVNIMLSEGELTLCTIELDDRGRQVPTIVRTRGRPVFVTTTVRELVDEQLSTRVLLTSPDCSEAQTERILARQSLLHMYPPLPEWTPDELVLRAIPHVLERLPTLIPFAERLGELFPPGEQRARRDYTKVLTIIALLTFLHQRQRQQLQVGGRLFLVSSLADLDNALRILTPEILNATIHGLPKGAFKILEKLQADSSLTVREIRILTGLGETTVRRHLEALMERGFALKDDSTRAHTYSRTGKNLEESTNLRMVLQWNRFGEEEPEKWSVDDTCTNSPERSVSSDPDVDCLWQDYEADALRMRRLLQCGGTKPLSELDSQAQPPESTIPKMVPSMTRKIEKMRVDD
jgi:predicted transcriptional regulator